MKKITKDNLFKPYVSRVEMQDRAAYPVARSITDAEAADRERKTQKLRLARMAKEARERDG